MVVSDLFERRCNRCGASVFSSLHGIKAKERLQCETGHAVRTWDVVESASGQVVFRADQDGGALEPVRTTPEPEAV